MSRRVAVLGSINMDLVTEVPRLPCPGETVLGRGFARYPGGKGANQAVAVARLGGRVSFYGKVGEDFFGKELLQSLLENRARVKAVEQEHGVSSGITSILVAEDGENAIAYTPGANALVDAAYVDRVLSEIATAKVLLLQLEIPLETIDYLLPRLSSKGPLVILDPAPAQDISSLLLDRVDILTPNRGELVSLTEEEGLEEAAYKFLARGVGRVVCKAGNEGAYLIDSGSFRHFPSFPVDPVDTTAAGDAFNGTLAWALVEKSLTEAIRWANAAGALAAMRKGAQPSLPTRQEVESLLGNKA